MVNWLIIIILVIFAVIALKLNHFRHRIWILVVILIALFIYVSAAVVYKEHQMEFDSVEGTLNSVRIYAGWLGHGFQNLKSLTGNAVKMDWSSSDDEFLNKTIKKIKD